MRRLRSLICLAIVPLPKRIKPAIYRRMFGWEIGDDVSIGFSYLEAGHVRLGDSVTIGHGNIIRSLNRLEMGEGSAFVNLNQVFGAGNIPGLDDQAVVLGPRVRVMSRHFFDATGTISIGAGTVIGGRGSEFWSHGLFIHDGERKREPRNLTIGESVYVGSRAMIIHTEIPPFATVAAGSVVVKAFEADGERLLIGGNPAQVLRSEPVEARTRA